MKHYMRSFERGVLRPHPDPNNKGATIKVAAETMHIPGTKGFWKPNDFLPNLLNNTKPLLDRTHTPRGALRAITIDRNFSREKWLYNKKNMDIFDPRQSKHDIERCKSLKRISKRQEKQRTMRETMVRSAKSNNSPSQGTTRRGSYNNSNN